MKQADIRPGLLLLVINSHGINAPLRSLTTVETIERSNAGDWFCTIRYHGKRALVVLLFWLTINDYLHELWVVCSAECDGARSVVRVRTVPHECLVSGSVNGWAI